MRLIGGLVLGLALSLGCAGHMQTRTSCSLEPYALVEFYNFSEKSQMTYVQRYYNSKPIGEPLIEEVWGKRIYRFRVPPGYYKVGVQTSDGKTFETSDVITLAACDTHVLKMGDKMEKAEDGVIKSRRGYGIQRFQDASKVER